MVLPETHQNLMGEAIPETLLPTDPAMEFIPAPNWDALLQAARDFPASSFVWAELAGAALAPGSLEADVLGYAYARTGYHRGLDSLRRAGWRGQGPVPWSHRPNRGFLCSLYCLAVAADRIGEDDEAARCIQFLRDCSEEGFQALTANDPNQRRGARDANGDAAITREERPGE